MLLREAPVVAVKLKLAGVVSGCGSGVVGSGSVVEDLPPPPQPLRLTNNASVSVSSVYGLVIIVSSRIF